MQGTTKTLVIKGALVERDNERQSEKKEEVRQMAYVYGSVGESFHWE